MIVEARAALRQRADTWTECMIGHFGEAFESPDKAPWILLRRDMIPASTSSIYGSTGKRVVQDVGQVEAELFWPAHAGDDDAYAMAERFAALFHQQKIGPAQTGARNIAPIAPGDDAGAWIRIDISIPFSVSYFA